MPRHNSHKNTYINPMMKLWSSFATMNPKQIQEKLSRLPRWYVIHFLNYIHRLCIQDRTIGYSKERLEYFQRVLMCCPRALLTKFLISMDVMSLINLLERCDVLWTMFFVGLINLRRDSDVANLLTFLMENVNDENFVVGLMLFLEREAKNQGQGLPRELRQKIFDFFCLNWSILTYIVQVNYRDEMTQDINCLVSLMNRWMQEFSQIHGLALNPSLKVQVFTEN
jgi:hypothetical protein